MPTNKDLQFYLNKLQLKEENIKNMMNLANVFRNKEEDYYNDSLDFARKLWETVVKNRKTEGRLKGDEYE